MQGPAAPIVEGIAANSGAISGADTSWMLVTTAMVLLMTPVLAFFYGGLVRSKSVLNTMMMSFASLGAVGIVWAIGGYSLAFAEGNAWEWTCPSTGRRPTAAAKARSWSWTGRQRAKPRTREDRWAASRRAQQASRRRREGHEADRRDRAP